jgi:hypothetical protein
VSDGDADRGPLTVDVGVADLKGSFEGEEFDLDRTRKEFTWFVLATFGLTVLASLISAFTGDWKAMLQVLERLLPAQSAVVGATLGFYFISKPVEF